MTTLDRVYVRNADGAPLAPTKRFAKVRKMLDTGEAVVFSYEPFTIQFTQQKDVSRVAPMELGIDVGSLHVGLSAHDGKQEHIHEEVDTLEDESKRIAKRREARGTRRHYTIWHRKPRFNNRRRPAGWLPPSIQHKLDIHIDMILESLDILPVKRVTVEVPSFDTHKMVNPEVSGKGYAQGPQYGYKSVHEYVLDRDGHKCCACGAKKHLQVHHIESRLTGGDSPGNLITLCDKCHAAHHAGKLDLVNVKRTPSLKHASQTNVIGARLVEILYDVLPDDIELCVTDGRETARIREAIGLGKTHASDALVIAGGGDVIPCSVTYRRRKTRRHNRHYYKANLLKGGRKKRNTGAESIEGFRRYDIVLLDGKERCYIDGLRTSGYFKLRRMDGSLVVTSSETSKQKDSSVSYKRLKLLNHSDGYISWSEARGE